MYKKTLKKSKKYKGLDEYLRVIHEGFGSEKDTYNLLHPFV